MSNSITSAPSETEHPQVAIRRARKAQQKAAHSPKYPDGQAARMIRANATRAALSAKFASKSATFQLAISDSLYAYAKGKYREGTSWTPLMSAYSELDRKYSGRLTAGEIKIIKIAIAQELKAH
jgi:hypothetical protein